MSQSLRVSIIAAAGCAATLAAPACAQVATFTGGAPNDTTNWCDPLNWFPADIPADGSEIVVPAGMVANMANCGGAMRILGPVTAGGTIRFYTPVTFAADASLTNPIFELSTTPVPIGGTISVSGPDALWQGGLLSGGSINNFGSLLVERSFISGRASPRELINGCQFINFGTVRLRQGFKIEDTSRLVNRGTIECEVSNTIGRDAGTGMIQNQGLVQVPAGQDLTLTCGLTSSSELRSAGSLFLRGETLLQGTARVENGGTIRLLAPTGSEMSVGPVGLVGDGNVQLSSGAFRLFDVNVGVRGTNGAYGFWLTTIEPIDVSLARVYVGEDALLTWSRGLLEGHFGSSATPHFIVASGGRLSAVGAPGYAGGGDAVGVHFRVEGTMAQYATVRLFEQSRIMVQPDATYHLSHTRLDGDDTGLLSIQGTLEVNYPGSLSSATAFLSRVPTQVTGNAFVNVYTNDFLTSGNGSPSHFEFGGNTQVSISQGARWRSFGETIVTDGTPVVAGLGQLELASGSMLTIRNAVLETRLDTPGDFNQLAEIRADPGNGAGARLRNSGHWTWRAGAITFPDAAEPPVNNFGTMMIDCGSCQLRADLRNYRDVTILDTLNLAQAGAEYINHGTTELVGHIIDPTGTNQSRVTNHTSGVIRKTGPLPSNLSVSLDNDGTVQVSQGTLLIHGGIDQYGSGALTGGTWIIEPGGTLIFSGRTIESVGPEATVYLAGTFGGFSPLINGGTIYTDGTRAFTNTIQNFGHMGGTGDITIPALINKARLGPGHSPGLLTIHGELDTSDAAAVLEIELAGNLPVTQHDVLEATGAVRLGGTLRIVLLDGFVPQIGDSFTILNAGSLAGEFAAIDQPPLPGGMRLALHRSTTSISVVIACPADFNADSAVDFFDYLDFVQAFADNSPAADFNRDSIVDFFDYLDFVQAFSLGC